MAEKDPKVSTGQALFEESVFTFDGLMLIPVTAHFKAMVGVGGLGIMRMSREK